MNDQVKVTPGLISYVDHDGKNQSFYFQCNPTSLTRSRSATLQETRATNPAGTRTSRGEAGRKYTHQVSKWKIESLELWFDASMPYWTDAEHLADEENLTAVLSCIQHLERICEPGPVPTENDQVTGAPPQPSPPLLQLTLGNRTWSCYVSSISVVEKEFTPDLVPRQVKATLSFDVIETPQQIEQNKAGGKK
ncbi:hypothetical protein [Sorangium sp. So ce861]|uniref:hypothetical protein n=1 Tax=Sorangium sp. So ce861 TaxID=3133323 RepID=UPI003F5EB13E